MTREEAKAIIEKIQVEKHNGDSEDLRGALKIFAEQLNTEATHFVWELIQNAEDNEYKTGTPELRLLIEVTDPTKTPDADGCLVAFNNEVGFQEKHVRGICSVGRSSKNRAELPDYIGEKGIGFKSVFRVSDRPHIFSDGFQFCFSKPSKPDELGYIVPEWVEEVPKQVEAGVTTILLPLKPGVVSSVIEQLAKISPESILFLRKLKRFELGNDNVFSRSDIEPKLAALRCNAGESLYFIHSKPCDVSQAGDDPSRSGIKQSTITIAFPIKSHAACSGRIFAFLPTRLDSGLPFLINADFILNSNREGLLEDRRWNQSLRNSIAPAFIEAFMALLENAEGKQVGYRFVPVAADLTPGADFFASVINPIHNELRSKKCVLTKDGDCVLPEQTFIAGKLANKVLEAAPRSRADVRLLHPEWERDWEKRLKPLGVRQLNFSQLFDACNDPAWLKSRDAEWWETFYLLCSQCKPSAETIGDFPLLRGEDGNCRPINSKVFFKDADQTIPESLPGPGVRLFDAAIQARLQVNQPAAWQWLKEISGLRQFSIQSYISDQLLDWMAAQAAAPLLHATRFIADNLEGFLEGLLSPTHRIRQRRLREKMPWLLTDGNVLRPDQRGDKSLATPEILEGDTGWNVLFPALNRHFFIINDDYCKGLTGQPLEAIGKLFSICGATSYPSPQSRVANGQLDWAAPGWLLGLEHVGENETIERKIKALERWLKAKGFEATKHFLFCHTANHANQWERTATLSEFGVALKIKPWLRTSVGCVVPRTACMRTPELQDFFGASAAYVEADLPQDLLENLGVKTHLTAEVLLARLREMSSATNPDFELVQKIYRRLQDTTFDAGVFMNERLVFLSFPQPHWRLTGELVWTDAGELFDNEFGYVEKTYGNQNESELRRFFSEKLTTPERPKLEQYAAVWQALCNNVPVDRQIVEKKLKIILTQMTESQDELPDFDWWLAIKPNLKIWTTAGRFVNPGNVYVPDNSLAVEIYKDADEVQVAYLPKVTIRSLGFLRQSIGCKSLAENIQPRLSQVEGFNPRSQNKFITETTKDLIVLLICHRHGLQPHKANLQNLLKANEAGVNAIVVNFSLRDNQAAGTRPRDNDAYWDKEQNRLLLREGVDPETLRDAAAKSIAAQFFGDSKSADTEAEFFKLLMATPARGAKIKNEHADWNLNAEQEAWLREQNWQPVLMRLEEPEQPQPARQPSVTNRVRPATPSEAAPIAPDATPPTTAPEHNDIAQVETDRPRREQSSEPTPSNPATELHDANTTEPEVVTVRGHTRARQQRGSNREQAASRQATPEPAIGLATTSAQDKAALEKCAREFATKQLEKLGFDVQPMDTNNPGYDLKATKSGDVLKVEVKGHGGETQTVFVTQREWEEHVWTEGVKNESWELWDFQNLSKASGKKPIFRRIKHIPKSAKRESGYWIDMSQCSSEPTACE